MDGRAQILLLGPVAVEVDGTSTRLTSRQQALLLALLAIRPGTALTTEDILERAWGDAAPASARTAVRVQLARLRTMLRAGATDPLPHTSHGYALNPDVVGTDIADLTRLHRTALTTDEPAERLRITEEALHLWRGEPALTSFDDEELRVEGRRLLDVRLDLEDARIDALLALGQFTRASSDLVTLVAAEPLREPRTRQLMVALYWSGRQADALAAYRALRDHLAEELGVDPDADTTALGLAILRQDAALSPAIRDRPTPTAPGIVRRLVAPPDPRDIPTPTPQLAQLVADRLAAIDIDAQRWVLKAALLDEHATLPILTDALHASVPEMEHLAAQAAAAGLVRPGGDGVLILRSELRDRLLGGADAPALAQGPVARGGRGRGSRRRPGPGGRLGSCPARDGWRRRPGSGAGRSSRGWRDRPGCGAPARPR